MLCICSCLAFIFFFLMIPRPPSSTLFPTRRSSDLVSGPKVPEVAAVMLGELPKARRATLARFLDAQQEPIDAGLDRKSTRLNSSHTVISYAVFCLKKKKKK